MSQFNNFINGARSIAGTASKTLGTVVNTVNTLKTQGFGAALRSVNLLPGGETGANFNPVSAVFKSSASRDWRVRLSLPSNSAYMTSAILSPLKVTNGLVFPYTPSITMSHIASYDPMAPAHNNYPFLSYQNSKVDTISIAAPFFIEDSVEAAYWIAAVHYLKSVTKMSMGNDVNAGAPPPVLKLNGYGDYVFNNVPVVVTNFQLDLPNDVDYISTGITATMSEQQRMLAEQNQGFDEPNPIPLATGVAWAPVKSTITVTVQPLYSREQVRNFSLDKFIKGDYVVGDSAGKSGFV